MSISKIKYNTKINQTYFYIITLIFTIIYSTTSFIQLEKTFYYPSEWKAISKTIKQLFLWKIGNNGWEAFIYNEFSSNLSFPFDNLNITFNMTNLNSRRILTMLEDDGRFNHLFKDKNSGYCAGNNNSVNSGVGVCHQLIVNSNQSALPLFLTTTNTSWPNFLIFRAGSTPSEIVLGQFGKNNTLMTLSQICLDFLTHTFDGKSSYLFLTKSAPNYSLKIISRDLQRTLIKPLSIMTGNDQYFGIKVMYYLLIWTQKTAYVYLNTGIEFLQKNFNDFILDMAASLGFIYILTQNGIFQYLKSDFSFVSKINGIFDSNSKIQYVVSVNRLVCISGTKVQFYILEQPSPGSVPIPVPVLPEQPEHHIQPEQPKQPESHKYPQQIEQVVANPQKNNIIQTILISCISILSVIRPYNLQSTFLLLANFDLYNYHQTNYINLFGYILQQVQIFQDKAWNLIPAPALLNWMKSPYYPKHYEIFSNYKIVQVNNNDGLLINNTKPYFLLWLPFSFIIFLIFHKIFIYCKKQHFKKIKKFFVEYSIWANFLILAVIQNSYSIIFFSFSNLSLIFFFTPIIKIIQIATILFFGLFFLLMVQIFPLIPYFQTKKIKLIIQNPKFLSQSIIFGFLKCFWKITIECAIHFYFFETPGKQKIMLCLINTLSVILYIFFDYKYSLFEQKVVKWSQNIGQFIFVLFNFCLFLRYDLINTNLQIIQILNYFEDKCLILIGICSLISALFPYLQFIIQKILPKQKYRKIKKRTKTLENLKEIVINK